MGVYSGVICFLLDLFGGTSVFFKIETQKQFLHAVYSVILWPIAIIGFVIRKWNDLPEGIEE
jgi:hypothetical protein